MHFSQKLQHIDDKQDVFLVGNILRNLLHWNFTSLSGYWFMDQKLKKNDFNTLFTVTLQPWCLVKSNCDLRVFWNISNQIHWILCPRLLYILRRHTKSLKIRSMGAVIIYNIKTSGTFKTLTLYLYNKYYYDHCDLLNYDQ